MDQQLRIDFEGPFKERMTVFRLRLQAILPEIVSLSAARLENVRQCLLAYFAHAGADACRYSQASPDALHETAELSRSVFSRARQDATAAGMIRAERVRVKRGQKRPPDRVWIDHDRILELVNSSRHQVGSGGTSRDQVGSGGITIRKPQIPLSPNLSNPPSPAARQPSTATGVGGDYELIAGKLRKLGVGLAEQSAKQFLAAGGTLSEFMEIQEHFLQSQSPPPAAWGPGALWLKLSRWYPGCSLSEGWPPANAAHEQAKRDAAKQLDLDRYDAKQRQSAADRKRVAQERAATDLIKPIVDRMTPGERAEILDRRCPEWKSFRLHSGSNLFLPYFQQELKELQEANA